MHNRDLMMVSFSGIDGAGKSTQIHNLCEALRGMGLRVLRVTFWTDVAALTRFRDRMSHRVFRGEKGVGRPGRPVNRRDKNVTGWYLTCLRSCFYFLDVVKLRLTASEIRKSTMDVVVFDRYIYDELANLPLERMLTRTFIRMVLKVVPKPDLALLLDADPAEARLRKPEYPEDFLRTNRESFLKLATLAGMTIIEPRSIYEMAGRVREEFVRAVSDCVDDRVAHTWSDERSLP